MTSRPSARGFTLVELLVATLVSAVIVAGALTLLVGQQRTFQGGAGDRAMQEAGRVALERLTTELRLAGYGMDPAMAFDFGAAASPMDRAILEPGVGTVPFGGYACNDAVTCRDKTDGPDEIVLHFRDPDFGRPLYTTPPSPKAPIPPTPDELTLAGPLNTPLLPGQILQVVCYSGDLFWAYVTVGKRVEATADETVTVPLEGAVGGGTDFPYQNKFLENSCFSGEARAFKIIRSRYFIQSYADDGAVVAHGTAGARPYLMLDQGLLDENGEPLLTMVAPDVEDLQFTYLFPLAPAGTQVRGATLDEQLKDGPAGIDLAPTTIPPIPMYSTPSKDVARTTSHPSNIRSVRVAVVVRRPVADPNISEPILPALANRRALDREARRRRAVFQTTVAVPNMTSRAPTFPTYGQPGVAADAPLNHGGG
ncbi:MAG: PilW family protein [Anaeromyxobacteraceae bacterium]|nr:PilW family protein [Anaeromyxobacteraceae bacterium]